VTLLMSRFTNMPTLRPFRSRNFALIWTGALVSNVGTWMEIVALSSLVARETKSATQVALTSMAGFLPSAFASPIGGALADRFDRKRFLQTTLALETFFAIVLTILVATGERRTFVLASIVFMASTISSASLPNRQSVLPSLVETEDLPAAISLGSASWNGGRVLGPLFASLVALIGPSWAFAANAASFMVLLFAWNFVRLPPIQRGNSGASLRVLLKEGVQTIRRNPHLRFTVVFIAVLAGTAGPFIGLLAIMAKLEFGGGTGTTGLFVSAQGFGAVVGALLTTRLTRLMGRGRSMLASLAALPIGLAIYGLAPHPILAALALVLVGGSYMGAFASCQAILQLHSPEQIRARVLAVFSVSLSASYCLALLVHGPLADRTSVRTVTVLQAVLTVVGIAALAVIFPKWWDRLADGPAQVTPKETSEKIFPSGN
jgi:MFS family permease